MPPRSVTCCDAPRSGNLTGPCWDGPQGVIPRPPGPGPGSAWAAKLRFSRSRVHPAPAGPVSLRAAPPPPPAEHVSLRLRLDTAATSAGRNGVRLWQSVTLVLRAPASARAHPRHGVADVSPAERGSRGGAAAGESGFVDLEGLMGGSRVGHFCPAALRSQVVLAETGAGLGHGGAPGGRAQLAAGAAGLAADGAAGERGASEGAAEGAEGAASGAEARAEEDAEGQLLVLDWRQQQQQQREEGAGGVDGDGRVVRPLYDSASLERLPAVRAYDTLERLGRSDGGGLRLALPRRPPPPAWLAEAPAPSAVGLAAAGRGGDAAAAVAAPRGLAALRPAGLTVDRYVTGQGLLRGGMVISVRRSAALAARIAAACAAGGGGGGAGRASGLGKGGGGGGGAACGRAVVCVSQTLPWYIRPWLHTLALEFDSQVMQSFLCSAFSPAARGPCFFHRPRPSPHPSRPRAQAVPLREWLVSADVTPSTQRRRDGVGPVGGGAGGWQLCLHVPGSVRRATLRAAFSKAFLTVSEYPPDGELPRCAFPCCPAWLLLGMALRVGPTRSRGSTASTSVSAAKPRRRHASLCAPRPA